MQKKMLNLPAVILNFIVPEQNKFNVFWGLLLFLLSVIKGGSCCTTKVKKQQHIDSPVFAMYIGDKSNTGLGK